VPSDALVPLTLVVGDEELLVSRAIGAVLRLARELPEDVDVRTLEAAEVSPGDLTEILSPSLFAEQRVLVLRSVQDLVDGAAAELREIVADPPEGCALVCVHAGGQKGKALLTALSSSATRTVPAAGRWACSNPARSCSISRTRPAACCRQIKLRASTLSNG
jgi:DNA polymerase-3 subunit delta